MSASEQLAALAGGGLPVARVELPADVLLALVAVVEAAELICAEDENPLHMDQSPSYYSGLGEQADLIRPALAALDEKLGER